MSGQTASHSMKTIYITSFQVIHEYNFEKKIICFTKKIGIQIFTTTQNSCLFLFLVFTRKNEGKKLIKA